MEKVEKDKDFSKIHHPIIDGGIVAGMSRQAIKMYLVLNRYANYKTGIAYPSVKTIAELAGISKNDVRKTADKLEAMGLILTMQERKGLHVRKYYGIIKNNWVNPELALNVISKNPKRTRLSISRTNSGRFTAIPKNTDSGAPQNTEDIPQNTEERAPQNSGLVTVSTESKENHIIEKNINRNKDIDIQSVSPGTTPEVVLSVPVNKAKELAAEHGFFKAMGIIWSGFEEPESPEDFEKREKERIAKAKAFFEREAGFTKP